MEGRRGRGEEGLRREEVGEERYMYMEEKKELKRERLGDGGGEGREERRRTWLAV